MQNNEKLLKRAKKKYINSRFALALIQHNPDSSLIKGYKNTFYCNRVLKREDNKIIGTYCKNRWCVVCGGIRTAQLINGYLKQLEGLKDAQFVTLTLPTISEGGLSKRILLMEMEWRKIAKLAIKVRKDFKGLRKMECTIRPEGKYHYHFHLILENEDNAKWLISQWIKRFPQAGVKAQHYRKADSGSYLELFKYFTKIISRVENKDRALDNFERLDVIFSALVGKRTYQPFGGLKKISEDIDADLNATIIPHTFEGKIWRWVQRDWISEFGEVLTGFEPSESLQKLVRYCPDELPQTKLSEA
jgi:hypothetical protein